MLQFYHCKLTDTGQKCSLLRIKELVCCKHNCRSRVRGRRQQFTSEDQMWMAHNSRRTEGLVNEKRVRWSDAWLLWIIKNLVKKFRYSEFNYKKRKYTEHDHKLCTSTDWDRQYQESMHSSRELFLTAQLFLYNCSPDSCPW